MGIPDYPSARPHGFTAASLDRLSHWRQEPERLQALQEQAGVVLLHQFRVPVKERQAQLIDAAELPQGLDDAIWLGLWRERSIYALDVSTRPVTHWPELRFRDLRRHAMDLDPDHAAVLAYARAMTYWQQQHRHCGRCGGLTQARQAGHVRHCATCEVEHYPRSDPSMLVLVADPGDRALLGRQASWPANYWSGLAGFVEPGESIEDAVIREVWEEARIRVTGMRYLASQPWPFPASVLMGFLARAEAGTPQVEQDELDAATWFSRDDINTGLNEGRLHLPPHFTLSYRLIEAWFNAGAVTPLQGLLGQTP